jgi:hypothetical protein
MQAQPILPVRPNTTRGASALFRGRPRLWTSRCGTSNATLRAAVERDGGRPGKGAPAVCDAAAGDGGG